MILPNLRIVYSTNIEFYSHINVILTSLKTTMSIDTDNYQV